MSSIGTPYVLRNPPSSTPPPPDIVRSCVKHTSSQLKDEAEQSAEVRTHFCEYVRTTGMCLLCSADEAVPAASLQCRLCSRYHQLSFTHFATCKGRAHQLSCSSPGLFTYCSSSML